MTSSVLLVSRLLDDQLVVGVATGGLVVVGLLSVTLAALCLLHCRRRGQGEGGGACCCGGRGQGEQGRACCGGRDEFKEATSQDSGIV